MYGPDPIWLDPGGSQENSHSYHSYCGMVSLVRAAVLKGNGHTPSSIVFGG